MTAMRAKSKSLKLALLFLAAAAATGWLAGGRARSQTAPSAEEQPLPVAAQRITHQSFYTVERSFTGRVSARRTADLGFDRGGEIAEILVDDGSQVRRGEILARLESVRQRAERARLRAERKEVEANLTLARQTRARTADLVAQGHQSQQRLDEDEARVAALEASLARVDAAIAAIDVEIDQTELSAPFDGSVQQRLLDEGTVVTPGQAVLQVLEDGHLEARVGLPFAFGRRLKAGAAYKVHGPRGNLIPARLVTVTPGIRGETRTVLATLALGKSERIPVTDGEIITLTMTDQVGQDGFWVPVRALSADIRGLWRVYRLEPAQNGLHRVVIENVQILYAEEDRAFVTGSVDDRALIVSAGVGKVAPGKLVRAMTGAEG
ncbi:MAG: efflux RND transporter periplasmic adaptor subunit [Rhodothalassiaceae bacterium]